MLLINLTQGPYVIGQPYSGTIPYWSAKITNSTLIGCDYIYGTFC